jgi:hypothetical protein
MNNLLSLVWLLVAGFYLETILVKRVGSSRLLGFLARLFGRLEVAILAL